VSERLRNIIAESDAVLIAAGAGMGVESGLPDFRGREGLWRAYPPLRRHGLSFEQLASPRLFATNPALAWAFYGHRLHQYLQIRPHAGFAQLLQLCRSRAQGYFVVTSNVDGHFRKAGFDEVRMLEVHGSILHLQCLKPCTDEIWPVDPDAVAVDEARFTAVRMPHCPHCGALARPNILMFDDDGWLGWRTEHQWARYRRWLHDLWAGKKRLLIVEIGAGTAIPTIRNITEGLHREMDGAMLVRINPQEHRVPAGAIALRYGAQEGISRLVEHFRP